MIPVRPVLVAACFAAGCTIGGDVFPPRDGGGEPGFDAGSDAGSDAGPGDAGLDARSGDAGRPIVCVPGTPEGEVSLPTSSTPVTIDGAFTGTEWSGVEPLEGLHTDVYLDVRGGALVLLDDWRANTEGIDADCFHRFELTVGETAVTIRLFGDGRVEVDGTVEPAAGASGFGPSPRSPFDHTIFELSLPVAGDGPIDVCFFDPLSLAECEARVEEPMVFSVVAGPDSSWVARRSTRSTSLARLPEGERCATGDGVCEPGLQCSAPAPERRCVAD